MELSGKVIAILPLQSGTGKNGTEWKKQDYVIETHDQYPKKMCFNLWGDRIDQFAIQMSEEITVSFDIDCREWNGKWFNDLRAWKIDRNISSESSSSTQSMQQSAPAAFTETDVKDDLPF